MENKPIMSDEWITENLIGEYRRLSAVETEMALQKFPQQEGGRILYGCKKTGEEGVSILCRAVSGEQLDPTQIKRVLSREYPGYTAVLDIAE